MSVHNRAFNRKSRMEDSCSSKTSSSARPLSHELNDYLKEPSTIFQPYFHLLEICGLWYHKEAHIFLALKFTTEICSG